MSPSENESSNRPGPIDDQSCQVLSRHWSTVADPDPLAPLDPDLSAHLAGCASCQEQRLSYQRLVGTLSRPPRGRGPRPGWSAAVIAQLRRPPARARSRFIAAWAGGSAALAAAVAIVLFVRSPEPALPWTLPVEVEVQSARSRTVRAVRPGPAENGQASGLTAVPGDELAIRFSVGDFAHAEVRVFRGSELTFSCARDGGCQRQGDTLVVRVPLPLAGRYEPLLLWSRQAPPPPAAGPVEDAARLLGAGVRVQTVDPIVVR